MNNYCFFFQISDLTFAASELKILFFSVISASMTLIPALKRNSIVFYLVGSLNLFIFSFSVERFHFSRYGIFLLWSTGLVGGTDSNSNTSRQPWAENIDGFISCERCSNELSLIPRAAYWVAIAMGKVGLYRLLLFLRSSAFGWVRFVVTVLQTDHTFVLTSTFGLNKVDIFRPCADRVKIFKTAYSFEDAWSFEEARSFE